MKKLLLSLCVLASTLAANAYDFAVDGIYYNDLNYSVRVRMVEYVVAAVTYKDTNYKSYSGEVTIPSTVTLGGKKYLVQQIGANAFRNCTDLTSVKYDGINIRSIGECAFYNCTSLASLFSLDHVDTVGKHAFYNCQAMTEFDGVDNLTTIGDSAFVNCTNLKTFTFGSNLESVGTDVLASAGRNGTAHIACGVSVNIRNTRFSDFVIEPECTAIPKLPTEVYNLTINNNTLTSAEYSLSHSLVEQMINEAGQTAQTTIVFNRLILGEDVVNIGTYAFSGRFATPKSLIIEGNIKTIGNSAFNETQIGEVIIPESCQSIGALAFTNCLYLKSVTINSTTCSSAGGDLTFSGCTLHTIVDHSPDGRFAKNMLMGSYSDNDAQNTQVFVWNQKAYDTYKAASYNGCRFKNVYLCGASTAKSAEDVNQDGSVDTQDVLKVYDYMKAH